jgi:hypothetical protein
MRFRKRMRDTSLYKSYFKHEFDQFPK